jgi:hypothetical protein
MVTWHLASGDGSHIFWKLVSFLFFVVNVAAGGI